MTRATDIYLAALEAHRPREPIPPSEWAEQNIYLTGAETANPGPWRNALSPHAAGLMDACAGWLQGKRRRITHIVGMKSAQSAFTRALLNVIAYLAVREPDPCLYVMPTEQDARRIFRKRVLPMVADTPAIAELRTEKSRDVQIRDITLRNGFTLRSAWAGSPSTLASDPIRFVFNDEVDKYPPFSGREANPIDLAFMRTVTYGDRALTVTVSTPTSRAGLVCHAYEDCEIHLRYRVPCPRCGEYQALTFDRVKWPKVDAPSVQERAALIEAKGLAWYECEHCGGRIEGDEKPGMCVRGVWATDEQHVRPDGTIVGELPEGTRVGFHVNCLPVLIGKYAGFSHVAAVFLRAGDELNALMNFRNSYLGEVFESKLARPDRGTLEAKVEGSAPAGVVPAWTGALIAGADTQKDHFWYVVRAFGHVVEAGPEGQRLVKRSQLVAHGRCETFEDLRRVVLDTPYPVEGGRGFLQPVVVAIDSGGGTRTDTGGNRTHEVYEFALSDPARVWAVKGHGGKRAPERPVRKGPIPYERPDGQAHTVELRTIDTVAFKDEIAADLNRPAGESGEFRLNAEVGQEYLRQMTAEMKILIHQPSGVPFETWRPITQGAANHLWDAETYCRAAAWEKQVWQWQTCEEVAAETVRRDAESPSDDSNLWIQTNGRWL